MNGFSLICVNTNSKLISLLESLKEYEMGRDDLFHIKKKLFCITTSTDTYNYSNIMKRILCIKNQLNLKYVNSPCSFYASLEVD